MHDHVAFAWRGRLLLDVVVFESKDTPPDDEQSFFRATS
jgi:hypothetical protein